MMIYRITLITLLGFVFSLTNVFALGYDDWVVDSYVGNNGYDSVQLTGVYEFVDDPLVDVDANVVPSPNLLETGSGSLSTYDATGLAAFFDGNDGDDGVPTPSYNIGHAGDGLLNGDNTVYDAYLAPIMPVKNNTDPEEYSFTGLEFITPDERYDIPGNISTEDTGWINLGKQDGTSAFSYESVTSVGVNSTTLSISKFLDISFSFNVDNGDILGLSWTLTPLDNILATAVPFIGTNYFDHLAFIVKSANYFGVYDLDFNKIFGVEFGGNDLGIFQPVQLTGTIDNVDFGKGISHVSVWAHDPAAPNNVVPEPSTLILLGSGLLGLGVYARRRKK